MSSLKSRKRTERITNALCFIALIFLTCLCMLPIWWIFRSSLMSNAELFKWPPPAALAVLELRQHAGIL